MELNQCPAPIHPHLLSIGSPSEEICDGCRDSFRVAGWNHNTTLRLSHQIRLPWEISNDNGPTARHAFEYFERRDSQTPPLTSVGLKGHHRDGPSYDFRQHRLRLGPNDSNRGLLPTSSETFLSQLTITDDHQVNGGRPLFLLHSIQEGG
jgi:hypothetical protein